MRQGGGHSRTPGPTAHAAVAPRRSDCLCVGRPGCCSADTLPCVAVSGVPIADILPCVGYPVILDNYTFAIALEPDCQRAGRHRAARRILATLVRLPMRRAIGVLVRRYPALRSGIRCSICRYPALRRISGTTGQLYFRHCSRARLPTRREAPCSARNTCSATTASPALRLLGAVFG